MKKLEDDQKLEIQYMKQKYPLRFCAIHKKLYENEEKYALHTLKHHKLIAMEEQLAKFQCNLCCQVFQNFGNYNNHKPDCDGTAQYVKETDQLTAWQKHLLKVSQQNNGMP
ncbi:hypothetical protein ABPG72_012405 [Tetrahymena utriculariae]